MKNATVTRLLEFNKYFEKGSSCWIWHGPRNTKGYGLFWMNSKPHMAHKISYQLYYGPILPEIKVLHKCDNPSCVNPQHLFLGSTGDNNMDMKLKGRAVSGENHGRAKLNEDQVLEMRRNRTNNNVTTKELAKKYAIDTSTVRKIIRRALWAHI